MSGDSISAAILTTASVICAFAFIAAVYPSVITAGDPIMSRSDAMGDQIRTDTAILHETVSSDGMEVCVWVKNVGCSQISSGLIDQSDLFFGKKGNFERISYDGSASSTPSWSCSIEQGGDNTWDTGETLKVTIKLPESYAFESGEKYFVKFNAYNGISEEDYFTVS